MGWLRLPCGFACVVVVRCGCATLVVVAGYSPSLPTPRIATVAHTRLPRKPERFGRCMYLGSRVIAARYFREDMQDTPPHLTRTRSLLYPSCVHRRCASPALSPVHRQCIAGCTIIDLVFWLSILDSTCCSICSVAAVTLLLRLSVAAAVPFFSIGPLAVLNAFTL